MKHVTYVVVHFLHAESSSTHLLYCLLSLDRKRGREHMQSMKGDIPKGNCDIFQGVFVLQRTKLKKKHQIKVIFTFVWSRR